MNTKIRQKKPKSKKLKIFFSIFLVGIAFLIYYLKKLIHNFRDKDSVYSLQIQQFFISSYTTIFLNISKFTNHFFLFLIFIILIDNYTNIFMSFLLIQIVSLGYYFSSLIKLFFNDENPFIVYNNKEIYECGLGWGLSCDNIIVLTPFLLFLWDIISIKRMKTLKIFSFFFFLILFIFNSLSEIIKGTHFLSQIIFSFLIGFAIYQFICGLNLNIEKGDSLYILLKHYYIYFLINCFLIIVSFISLIYSIEKNSEKMKNIYCQQKDNKSINFGEKNGNNIINKGSFLLISIFIGNIFCYFSLKCQLFFTLKNNQNLWLMFNFNEMVIYSNTSDISESSIVILGETKWNKTSHTKSFLRLIISLFFSGIYFIPYFLISWNQNFYKIFFIKFLLPFFLFYFGHFFFFKTIIKNTDLINFTLFIQIEEKQEKLLNISF